MYICICHQITDSEIKQAVSNGHACCLSDLTSKLGVASCCGTCGPEAKKLVEEALDQQQPKTATGE